LIYLLTGLPGAGKTLFTVTEAPTILAHPGRSFYYSGIKDLKLDWEETNPETWYNLPDGSACIIDEAQNYFRPMPAGAERPRKITAMETHRHKGMDLWLITQHPNLLDSHVRRLVGKHYHVYRAFGLQGATVMEWEKAEDPDDYHAKQRSVKRRLQYKRESFALYKSAEVHTVKRRLPLKLIAIPFLLAAVAGLAWFGYSTLRGSAAAKSAKAEQKAAAVHMAQQPSPLPQGIQRASQIVEARLPAIPDLTHTAPRYDAMTAPKAVPVVRGCFADLRQQPESCWCVSQRGTRMDVSHDFCMQVVRVGRPFYDFETDDEARGVIREQVASSQPHPQRVQQQLQSKPLPSNLDPQPTKLPAPL